jgi:predicted ATPase
MSARRKEIESKLTQPTERFFVITGGPGSGKSSLLDALEKAGFGGSIEAGRAIIQKQMAIGGSALPWADRALFAEMMLSWEIRSYRYAERAAGPVFFDRSVVDVMGYLDLEGLAVPDHARKAAETFRFHRRVFIAPAWEEIYTRDAERKQSFEEAVKTECAMRKVYPAYRYELIELPRAPVKERVEFVIDLTGVQAGR